MMRAPSFWWRAKPSLLAHILSPFGAFYGGIAQYRMERAGQAASIPVICVGNPVAGGAGKTPAAIEIARLLILAGKKPVFLTRGYGGALRGPEKVDVRHHSAGDVGDEALLLAKIAPCIVSADRVKGAALAAKHGNAVVMDDGFQNPSLAKDMVFLVIDSSAGVGNGLCIPAGPLRAPLDPQLERADAVIVVGDERGADWLKKRKKPRVLRARLVPDAKAAAHLKGKRVLAFAGIGRPQKFAGTLKGLGADVVSLTEFPDHHVFTAADQRRLLDKAAREGLVLVTTEKDRARLKGELAERAIALPVRLAFDEPKLVSAALKTLFS